MTSKTWLNLNINKSDADIYVKFIFEYFLSNEVKISFIGDYF